MIFVNEWLHAGYPQDEIFKQLKLKRQAAVSDMKIVIEQLGMPFVQLLDEKVPLSPLHAFARRCRSEKSTESKPNTELRDKILASRTLVTKDLLTSIKPKVVLPVPKWYRNLHLQNLGGDPRFSRAHPTFAAMLNEIAHYDTMEEWLAAHPATKTGVTKAKK